MSRPRKYIKRKADGQIKARTNVYANERQGEALRGMNSKAVKDILKAVPDEFKDRAKDIIKEYIQDCKSEGRTARTNGALSVLNNQLVESNSLYAKNRTLILNLGMSTQDFADELGSDIDLDNTALVEGKNVIENVDGSILVFNLNFNYDSSSAISNVARYATMADYMASARV